MAIEATIKTAEGFDIGKYRFDSYTDLRLHISNVVKPTDDVKPRYGWVGDYEDHITAYTHDMKVIATWWLDLDENGNVKQVA